MSRSIVILCPLKFEAAHARRALRGLDARVVVTGPGAVAVRHAVDRLARQAACSGRELMVVLFGACGGLCDMREVAPLIGRVRDLSGRVWGIEGVQAGVAVVGVDRAVITPGEKAWVREKSGAELVDCESHGFAEACVLAGLRWRVVRGVSDGEGDALPRGIEGWVRSDGATRFSRVAWACVTSPRLVPAVLRLGRRSGAALREAGASLRGVVEDWLGEAERESAERPAGVRA